MKPNFALSLSFSGIQLLLRQDNGWGRVGDVDLGTADLSGDLAALRSKAEALGYGAVETKLIIPDDQIKYLSLPAEGLDPSQLQSAVQSALDGATPYAVDELSYDFALQGSQVHVAAVARETLQEAEAFASEHNFAPLGFVAAPSSESFPREVSFGLSDLGKARGLDGLGADTQAAVATGEAKAKPEPKPKPEPAPEPAPATQSAPKPEPKPEPAGDVSAKPASQPQQSQTEPTPKAEAAPETPPLGFASRRSTSVETPTMAAAQTPRLEGAQRDVSGALPKLGALPAATQAPATPNEVPQVTGRSDAALDPSDVEIALDGLRPGAAQTIDDFDEDIPPMPAGLVAQRAKPDSFASALVPPSAAAEPTPAFTSERTADIAPNESSKGASGAKAAALAGAAGSAAKAGFSKLMAKRKAAQSQKAQVKTQPDPDPADAAREAEKQRMTVFGARKPKKKKEPIPVGGKPRFLGLILTAILLLFLVSVAAWASVFLDEGLARFFGTQERERPIAELPAPDQAGSQESGIQVAALDDGLSDIDAEELPSVDGALSDVVPLPPPVSPEEAQAKYAATGIWMATPVQPNLPASISLDDVYTASIDGRVIGQDAFALTPNTSRLDQRPSGLAAPPPAGAKFTLDENGFVVATPEGAVTPEGALVFLGRPAVTPPAIPERLRQAAPQEQLATPEAEDVPAAVVATLRPRARPTTLVEDTERTQLGGITRAELAKLRPKLRPRLEKEQQETEAAEVPASALAVASSRVPSSRPRNFSRIVSRAQKQAEREPQQQATQVASVAPRSVKPRIPSSASVSKAATVKNAINLSRVNLIGVYGKPSSRRALVRLSSGRYKKVKVGDRVEGGRVSAIGESQLVYNKNGRSVTLRMPKG